MFITREKYDELVQIATYHREQYQKLLTKWNPLIEKINAKGGQAFLNGESQQFSQPEIRSLIKLCHPDKHGGSDEAHQITVKLLKMKK